MALARPGFGLELSSNPPTCLPKQPPCVTKVPGLAGKTPPDVPAQGKAGIHLGMLFWHWDFQPLPLNPCPETGTESQPRLWHRCALWGSKFTLQSAQFFPKLCQNWGVGSPPGLSRTLTCWWASCSTCCWCRLARKSWCCSCCCFRASSAVSWGFTTRCPILRSMGTAWGTRGEVHGVTAAVGTQRDTAQSQG